MSLLSRFTGARSPQPAKASPPGRTAERAYPGVEIIPLKGACCDAVRALAGQRLLARDAPMLPLRECDQTACGCRYQRFPDRRTDVRRDTDLGLGTASAILRQAGKSRRGNTKDRRGAGKPAK